MVRAGRTVHVVVNSSVNRPATLVDFVMNPARDSSLNVVGFVLNSYVPAQYK
jgi:hypothetical protein